MAFPDGWTKRWAININADSVTTGVVTDWPCLVTDAHFPADAWANLQATGADLRFSSDEAGLTELYYDTPRLDVAGQKAHLYVRVPSLLASEDTVIYGWCGNASATAPSAAWMQNTYHADIAAWWPMEEGTGITVGDRTANANHGTMTNMDPATDWVQDANGDWYLDFDGSGNNRIEISDSPELDFLGNRMSAVVWTSTGTATGRWLLGKTYNATHVYPYCQWLTHYVVSGFFTNFRIGSSYASSAKDYFTSGWHLYSVVWNGSNVYWHRDNSLFDSAGAGFSVTDRPYSVLIGANASYGEDYDGEIGAVALFSDAISADEIACHHLMLSDPATWATAGALESVAAGGPYLYHGRALGRIGPSMAGVR